MPAVSYKAKDRTIFPHALNESKHNTDTAQFPFKEEHLARLILSVSVSNEKTLQNACANDSRFIC